MKEYKNYIKGKKIAEELLEVLKDPNSESSQSRLSSALKESGSAEELINRFSSVERAAELTAKAQAGDKAKDIERLKMAIDRQRRIRLIKRVSVAASTAVAAAMVVALFIMKPADKPLSQQQEVAEVKKPTLRIGNNVVIDLGEELAGNAYGIEKLANNQIRQNQSGDRVEILTLQIPSNYTYSVVLEDGTEVFLNANSQFKYPTKFGAKQRAVELMGEAYFKVKKSTVPFVVTLGGMQVKVLGTEFNCNSNRKDRIETVLVKGSVAICDKDSEFVIKPGYMAVYNGLNGKSSVEKVDVNNYINWRDGVFRYTSSSLSKIVEDLSTWYGVEFENVDNLKNARVTMQMDKTAPLDEILNFIEMMTDVKFTKERRGTYTISR